MIKRYNQFLKESKEEFDLQEAITEVLDRSPSYSDLCKRQEDPDIRFNEIQSDIDDYRWTLERIRNEYSDVDLINLYRLMDSISGYVDLYFYKLFEKFGIEKNIVDLGGSGWGDIYITKDEAFIRYSYGYHNTKYGMMFINQLEGGLEGFMNQALSYLKDYIIDDVPQNILSIYDGVGGFYRLIGKKKDINNLFEMENYIITEEDRVVIFLKEIAEYFNNILSIDNKKLSYYLDLKPDIIASNITKFLSNLNLDINFTGNELIVWSKFGE
jgi:hypothetical protein